MKTPPRSKIKTPQKNKPQEISAAKTPKKTPRKTPKKNTDRKQNHDHIEENSTSHCDEAQLLTPILKKTPPGAGNGKKLTGSALGKSVERSVSFSVKRGRRHSSSKRYDEYLISVCARFVM